MGLSVHNEEDSENLLKIILKQESLDKLFPVHRLDRETSGVQLLALNKVSAQKLSQEFQEKRVEKIYIGILRGQLSSEKGVWERPLTDLAEGRKNPSGKAVHRRPCETRYRTLKASRYFTQCEFNLITGRQHQIRKHTALEGHSLVGDSRYGDKKYNKKIAELYSTNRMFLHCLTIDVDGMNFKAHLPVEFNRLFES